MCFIDGSKIRNIYICASIGMIKLFFKLKKAKQSREKISLLHQVGKYFLSRAYVGQRNQKKNSYKLVKKKR